MTTALELNLTCEDSRRLPGPPTPIKLSIGSRVQDDQGRKGRVKAILPPSSCVLAGSAIVQWADGITGEIDCLHLYYPDGVRVASLPIRDIISPKQLAVGDTVYSRNLMYSGVVVSIHSPNSEYRIPWATVAWCDGVTDGVEINMLKQRVRDGGNQNG